MTTYELYNVTKNYEKEVSLLFLHIKRDRTTWL